jgi:ribonuclease HI
VNGLKTGKLTIWRSSNKKPVKNKDLWVELDEAVDSRKIHWEWVKGHAGNEGNEKADELANQGVISAMRGIMRQVFLDTETTGLDPKSRSQNYRNCCCRN